MSSVNFDNSTVIGPDEPVLREPLRAKLAKWRRGAAELLARPAQLLPRAPLNDFAAVLAACEEALPQDSRLAPRLLAAFITLRQEGHAHSIEVRTADGTLAGGLYGIVTGKVFFAEAKFEHVKKASMVALAVLHHHLSHWGFAPRSARWGAPAHMVSRGVFRALLDTHAASDHCAGPWTIDPALDTYAWSGRPRGASRRPRNGPLLPLSLRKPLTHDKLSASYRPSCAPANGAWPLRH